MLLLVENYVDNRWNMIQTAIYVIFDFISRNEQSFYSQNTMTSETFHESDIVHSLFLLTCSMISPASPLSTFSFSKLSSWWLRGKSQPVNSLVNFDVSIQLSLLALTVYQYTKKIISSGSRPQITWRWGYSPKEPRGGPAKSRACCASGGSPGWARTPQRSHCCSLCAGRTRRGGRTRACTKAPRCSPWQVPPPPWWQSCPPW